MNIINFCRLTFLFTVSLIALSACVETTSTAVTSNSEESGFPASVTIASPTEFAAGALIDGEPGAKAVLAGASSTRYAFATARIQALLNGSTPIRDLFNPESFYTQATDAACYGPKLYYQNHPEGADGGAGGDPWPSLPSGDLGIWNELEGATTEACAAAQLNKRLAASRDQTMMSLMALASLISVYEAGGSNWPSDVAFGSTTDLTANMNALAVPNVTFASATMALNAAGNEWTYALNFAYTRGVDTYNIQLSLAHYTGSSASEYEGLLNILIDDTFNPPGNCPNSNVTRNVSLHYVRNSAADMRMQGRSATVCGHGTSRLTQAVTPINLSGGNVLNPNSAWGNNYSVFTAEFNPLTLGGHYSFAWQAGEMDDRSRVLNVGLAASTVGEAYFGYAESVQNAGFIGAVKGFICNWAGPGNNHTLTEMAQRQHITFNSTTAVFEPTNAAASDITYAPTTTCLYDGSGAFLYDRDVDSDLNDEVAATVNVGPAQTLVLDLAIPTGAETTIWGHIQNNRGYDLPDYPN